MELLVTLPADVLIKLFKQRLGLLSMQKVLAGPAAISRKQNI
ncbi:MAG TPA: hypothetical protein VFO91_17250 [Anaerolineales bacterium]|nr:hypothetical protein [Anaerolineales bacterium]